MVLSTSKQEILAFFEDSLLIEEYDNSSVSAYTIDGNGDAIANTRRDFITGLGFHSPTSLTGVMAIRFG